MEFSKVFFFTMLHIVVNWSQRAGVTSDVAASTADIWLGAIQSTSTFSFNSWTNTGLLAAVICIYLKQHQLLATITNFQRQNYQVKTTMYWKKNSIDYILICVSFLVILFYFTFIYIMYQIKLLPSKFLCKIMNVL